MNPLHKAIIENRAYIEREINGTLRWAGERMFETPFIIADVGSNHRGSLELALKHIEAAKECGCDVVKFQLYTYEELYGVPAPEGHDRKYEMPREWVPELKAHATKMEIDFMCSAFSPEGYRFLDPFVKAHKIASSEMKHVPILETVSALGKPWIISTGGAHFSEVEWVIQTYRPTVVLECVANYPAETSHYNLRVVREWETRGVQVLGVSDHTRSLTVSLVSVGLGATVFERHFDSEGGWANVGHANGETPDSAVSLDSDNMKLYVGNIREAFLTLGDGIKQPAHQHEMVKKWRRRLKITRPLKARDVLKFGENFGMYRSLEDDLRAGPCEAWEHFEGKRVKGDMKPQEGLWIEDVE